MTTQEVTLLPTGSVYLDRGRPLTPQVVDDLKVRILNGQYPQSGPLPSVSGLAEFYVLSDQIISNALNNLIKEGWIIKEGYGRYVVAAIIPPVNKPDIPMTSPTPHQPAARE